MVYKQQKGHIYVLQSKSVLTTGLKYCVSSKWYEFYGVWVMICDAHIKLPVT